MKNIFKLMGVALLAGAMLFTACKEEEEEEATPAITVSFDGAEWTSDAVMDYVNATYFDVYKDGAELSSMQFACRMTAGTQPFAGTDDVWVKYWDDNDVEYNTPANDGTIVVTDVQPDARTISASINANMMLNEVAHPLTATLVNAKWNTID